MIRRHRLRSFTLALAVAALAATSACTSAASHRLAAGDPLPSVSTSPPTTPQPSPSGTTPATGPVAPLTGRPGTPTGAAVLVPINVTPGGSAPRGLADADLVSVDFGERGLFHLAATYQSHTPSKVGPAAEVRPSDLKVFDQTRALIAQSGSPSGFLDVAASIHMTVRKPGERGYSRSGGHEYVDVGSLRAGVKNAAKPTGIFAYAAAGQPVSRSGVKTVHKVSIKASGHSTMSWTFDTSKKLWRAKVGGITVTTANLVIVTSPTITKHVSALRRDLTFANPLGQGDATVFAGTGRAHTTWFKKNITAAMNFLAPDQDTPYLVPGSTWILLAPSKAKVTSS